MTAASCEVLPGAGSVARRGDSVLWASERLPEPAWAALLACLALGDRLGPGTETVLRAVAEAVAASVEDDNGFAIALSDGVRGLVLTHGHAVVSVDGVPAEAGPVVTIDVLGRSLTAGPAHSWDGRGPDRSGRHDLREGAVPGGGLHWQSGERSGSPYAASHADAEAEVHEHQMSAAEELPEPTSSPEPESTASHPVPGFDSTGSNPIPPAPALVFEDGTVTRLTGDVVLGRRPERHDLVTSGAAQPMVISDPEHVLSGAHATVRLDREHAVVIDLDSLNGTHLAAPEARDWTRLVPGTPYPISDGYRMLLGWTQLTFRADAN